MAWTPIVTIAVGGRVISSVKVKTQSLARLNEAENIAQVASRMPQDTTVRCLTFRSACSDTVPRVPILSAWARELANS